MFRSISTNWVVWLRAVTVTVAVAAILVSALAISPEINLHVLPAQTAAVVADAGVVEDGPADPAQGTTCHVGHSCMPGVVPDSELALIRFESAPGIPRATGYQTSVAGYLPFHPPRAAFQV